MFFRNAMDGPYRKVSRYWNIRGNPFLETSIFDPGNGTLDCTCPDKITSCMKSTNYFILLNKKKCASKLHDCAPEKCQIVAIPLILVSSLVFCFNTFLLYINWLTRYYYDYDHHAEARRLGHVATTLRSTVRFFLTRDG